MNNKLIGEKYLNRENYFSIIGTRLTNYEGEIRQETYIALVSRDKIVLPNVD